MAKTTDKYRKQAILIGINEYEILSPLKYARQDAQEVAQALKQNCGFEDEEVIVMTDQQPGLFKPGNRTRILQQLEELKTKNLDFLLLGFWGHGVYENGERYLCPMDADEKFLPDLGFPMSRIIELVGAIRAKNTLLILDCCQSDTGRAEAPTLEDESLFVNAARDIVLQRKERFDGLDSRVFVFNSCKKGERAYEWDAKQHGIFTAHLLDALNRGEKSVAEIARHLGNVVPKTAQELGKRQTPLCVLEGDILLPQGTATPKKPKSRHPHTEPQAPVLPATWSTEMIDAQSRLAACEKRKNQSPDNRELKRIYQQTLEDCKKIERDFQQKEIMRQFQTCKGFELETTPPPYDRFDEIIASLVGMPHGWNIDELWIEAERIWKEDRMKTVHEKQERKEAWDNALVKVWNENWGDTIFTTPLIAMIAFFILGNIIWGIVGACLFLSDEFDFFAWLGAVFINVFLAYVGGGIASACTENFSGKVCAVATFWGLILGSLIIWVIWTFTFLFGNTPEEFYYCWSTQSLGTTITAAIFGGASWRIATYFEYRKIINK